MVNESRKHRYGKKIKKYVVTIIELSEPSLLCGFPVVISHKFRINYGNQCMKNSASERH